MRGTRLQMVVGTRPARDAALAFLTGVEPDFAGEITPMLAELREESGHDVAVAFEDGGLLQSLDAWGNTLLPVMFRGTEDAATAERRARGFLAALGRKPAEFIGVPGSLLTLYERRLLGFVRAVLVEPRLLVLDRLFEDLGGDERQGIAACIELFGRRYPLRRMLYLGFAEVNLPEFEAIQ